MKFKNRDMDQILLNFLAKYIELSEEEKNTIIDLAFFTSFKKGTVILKEGQLSKDSYFIVKGCVRCYYIIDGEEKTTAFYSDGESFTPPSALTNKPSEYYVSCLEDTVLSAGDAEPDEELFNKFPKLEKLCRILSEDLHSKSQIAFDNFKISSPEQRYLHLLETRPDLVQRIPQYYLASYLGITPQSLSRMRNRLVKKVS